MIAQASQSHPRMRQMRIVGIDAPEFLWYDMEVKLYMSTEEIQAVMDAAA